MSNTIQEQNGNATSNSNSRDNNDKQGESPVSNKSNAIINLLKRTFQSQEIYDATSKELFKHVIGEILDLGERLAVLEDENRQKKSIDSEKTDVHEVTQDAKRSLAKKSKANHKTVNKSEKKQNKKRKLEEREQEDKDQQSQNDVEEDAEESEEIPVLEFTFGQNDDDDEEDDDDDDIEQQPIEDDVELNEDACAEPKAKKAKSVKSAKKTKKTKKDRKEKKTKKIAKSKKTKKIDVAPMEEDGDNVADDGDVDVEDVAEQEVEETTNNVGEVEETENNVGENSSEEKKKRDYPAQYKTLDEVRADYIIIQEPDHDRRIDTECARDMNKWNHYEIRHKETGEFTYMYEDSKGIFKIIGKTSVSRVFEKPFEDDDDENVKFRLTMKNAKKFGNRILIGDTLHSIYPDSHYISKNGTISEENVCTEELELYQKFK